MWRVALPDGFDAVSVRSVAKESDWSAGALRHYFPDRTEMVLFAVDFVVESVRQRIGGAGAAAGSLSPEPVQATPERLLPLDDERRLESGAWFAPVALARRDSSAARRRAEADELIRGAVDSALAGLAELGRLGPAVPGPRRRRGCTPCWTAWWCNCGPGRRGCARRRRGTSWPGSWRSWPPGARRRGASPRSGHGPRRRGWW
ncbi:TetR/AcrR family transcriptional regulator [Streptomyces sp. IBSBF 2435]|uniref:TetR/AcrR family transcriptional regulator n=1 Tax=Streptomyces sp. IBSBF 2435 TaxID=2903531 RepID=UPI002FDC6C18